MDERYKKAKNKWIYWVISLRPCIVNILFPPDLIYKIKAMSIKNQAIFFCRYRHGNPKVHWKGKRNSQNNSELM